MRFGIEVPQDAPFPALIERWRRVEELGFDHLWVADHSADTRTDPSGNYRNLDGTWFDGWTVLAVMAMETTRIRIGTLVSNPVLRPPALLAKEALTIDHLSGGRLELGIGTGIEPLDHATMGIDYWSAGERVAASPSTLKWSTGCCATRVAPTPLRAASTAHGRQLWGLRPFSGRGRRSPSAVSHRASCGSLPSGLIAGTPPGRLA